MDVEIHCGTFHLDLKAYTREYLEAGMSLAFAARSATAYAYTSVFGLIFFQYLSPEEGMTQNHEHYVDGKVVEDIYRISRFGKPRSVGPCTHIAWDWLQEVEYDSILVGRRTNIQRQLNALAGSADSNYSIKKGFHLRTSDDGIVGDHHGAICTLHPEYMVCYG